MTKLPRLMPLVVAGLFFLGACGGTSTDESRAIVAGETGGAGAPERGPTAGDDLLSFSAPAIGGGSIAAADFRGRPTLLWFWAPW